ncbi:hypothetical protein LR68_02723 [Anoxybacillus sp. BCO1]|nr:hypothetical protein LR68_02723 [Anoxybacillus sp. BCO1]
MYRYGNEVGVKYMVRSFMAYGWGSNGDILCLCCHVYKRSFYVQKQMSRPLLSFVTVIQTMQAATVMAIILIGYIMLTNELPVHQGRLFSSLQAIVGVFIGAFVYIIMVVKKGVFDEKELLAIPLGRYLTNIKQRKAG